MIDTFYIDPIVEAKKYGITVIADIKNPKILQTYENGIIEKTDKGITIYVSPDDTLEKQRFTIAHELGHFMCGHLKDDKIIFRDGDKEFSKENSDIQEYEANNYALELLIPKQKIDFLIYEDGLTTIEELAEAFIVSYETMLYRLQNLGLIS